MQTENKKITVKPNKIFMLNFRGCEEVCLTITGTYLRGHKSKSFQLKHYYILYTITTPTK